MTDPTTAEGRKELKELAEKATPLPWQWTAGCREPQLEGAVPNPEMNPVLVARGCGNDHDPKSPVQGCMPSTLAGDDLRSCPLHPSRTDREYITAAANALPALIARIERLEKSLEPLVSFVTVMVGRGPDAIIPETINTPLGVPVKIGEIMRDARAALTPANAEGGAEGSKA